MGNHNFTRPKQSLGVPPQNIFFSRFLYLSKWHPLFAQAKVSKSSFIPFLFHNMQPTPYTCLTNVPSIHFLPLFTTASLSHRALCPAPWKQLLLAPPASLATLQSALSTSAPVIFLE